ncbi:hypothetical protein K458DRAFT_455685 [Lentithecium fluviatile CBS 122367]|uniref:Uncharacterized protein n=1 Tax=Lentithecium fluviatile CBS 122367 TaxID=1168545 RepID=A0A6G1JLM0_9PLEO|nr:hypothetical protein K458DRAFT_455685 [Lentithecium fluviatile CBS 122367]
MAKPHYHGGIHPKESDDCAEEVDRVDLERYQDVFGLKYGFRTESFIIPRKYSARKLQQFLTSAELEHCENGGLLIVVYVGCGEGGLSDVGRIYSSSKGLFIYPLFEAHDRCERIDWTFHQRVLENSTFNTLITLDTCSSRSAVQLAKHKSPSSLEFLTACSPTGLALVGPRSFSAALCATLKDMAAEHFTISRLHERLCHPKTNLYETPFYARFPGNGTKIQLQVVKPKDSVIQDPEKIHHAPANLQSITFDIEQASLKSDEDNIASFVAQLNFSLGINENLGQRYYQSVTVLPVMWKKPTINYLKPEEEQQMNTELAEIRDELNGITDVFRDDFHYHVKPILELPADDSNDARHELIDHIQDLTRMHSRSKSSLLIIVYGGHGDDTGYITAEEGDCVWVAVSKSTTEILAAASRNAPSYSGPRAYSKLLKKKLKEKSFRPFTAFELHEEMLAASKAPLSGDSNNLEATPDHGFTQRSRTASILLKPLEPVTVQTITNKGPFASELPKRRIFLEVESDQLQGLEDCVSESGNWFTKRHPPPNMRAVKFYTPEDIFVKAIVEKNSLLKQSVDGEPDTKLDDEPKPDTSIALPN